MRWNEIISEEGKIVPGVNTTADVQPGEIKRQGAKMGFNLSPEGLPPVWTGLSSSTGAKNTPNKSTGNQRLYGPDGTEPNRKAHMIEGFGNNLNDIPEDWSKFVIVNPEFDADDDVQILEEDIVDVTLLGVTEPIREKEGIEQLAKQIITNKYFVRVEVNEDYEILDGHHRYLAISRVLGWTHIPIVMVTFDSFRLG